MDQSVICVEDVTDIIDLSENSLESPQNSTENLIQDFLVREKRKKNRNTRMKSAIPEIIIDLSDESVIDLCKDSTQSEGKRKSTDLCCPICFEKYTDVPLKATICGHVFCSSCIETTVKEKKSCPKCRKKLTLKNLIPIYL